MNDKGMDLNEEEVKDLLYTTRNQAANVLIVIQSDR